jgi:hypothetical protein
LRANPRPILGRQRQAGAHDGGTFVFVTKVPDQPYVLPHRPKSDPRLLIAAVVGLAAALFGLPGETAAELTEDISTAVNAVLGALALVAAAAAGVRAAYHRHIQRVQLTVAAPAYVDPDPTNPTEVPPLPGHLR